LIEALQSGHEDVAQILINSGSDVMLRHEGGSTLTHATRNSMHDIIRILLEHGADIESRDGVILSSSLVNTRIQVPPFVLLFMSG